MLVLFSSIDQAAWFSTIYQHLEILVGILLGFQAAYVITLVVFFYFLSRTWSPCFTISIFNFRIVNLFLAIELFGAIVHSLSQHFESLVRTLFTYQALSVITLTISILSCPCSTTSIFKFRIVSPFFNN
jgi:hypothetical protein